MSKELRANEEIIKKAVSLITETFIENDIPKLEGACAMRALLQALVMEGLDVRVETKMDS